VQSQPPPPSDPESSPPDGERERRRLERILPVLIKRILEAGYEKITEGPENVRQMAREMRLPKEALALILSQIDESKNGIYRAVAKEIRDFLEHTNVAEELAKALTTLSFEVKTEVRFIPNDSRLGASPDVRSRVRVKRRGESERPTRPSQPPEPQRETPPSSRPSTTSSPSSPTSGRASSPPEDG
jgi:hypothetical protein